MSTENTGMRAGDSDQITRDYFDSLLVEMRHIGARLPDTTFQLYDETFATPIMPAALSHLDKTYPNGMVEVAKAAAAVNTAMWAGLGDEDELEALVATGAKTIKIIKPYADNGKILSKIEHAQAAGAFAVGMDLDHAFNSTGGFENIRGAAMAPKSVEEFASFVKASKLPFILKGVLSERDAQICMDVGVRGIVVSHHHGLLDYAVPPLQVLPRIAAVVNGNMPIFVDCGVQSGLDAFKALALGAIAVSVGRPLVNALKDGGAQRVQYVLEKMTSELRHTMGLTASADLAHIDSALIHHRTW